MCFRVWVHQAEIRLTAKLIVMLTCCPSPDKKQNLGHAQGHLRHEPSQRAEHRGLMGKEAVTKRNDLVAVVSWDATGGYACP